jgi:stage V sporulation protein R
VGINLWATEQVAIRWAPPPPRLTVEKIGELVGVSTTTVRRSGKGLGTRVDGQVADLIVQYRQELAHRGSTQDKRRKPIRVPVCVDERLGAFLGYLIGDGHISARKRTIGLTTGDEPQADHFAQLTRELFDLDPQKKWDATKWRIKFSSLNVQEFLIHLGLKTGPCA